MTARRAAQQRHSTRPPPLTRVKAHAEQPAVVLCCGPWPRHKLGLQQKVLVAGAVQRHVAPLHVDLRQRWLRGSGKQGGAGEQWNGNGSCCYDATACMRVVGPPARPAHTHLGNPDLRHIEDAVVCREGVAAGQGSEQTAAQTHMLPGKPHAQAPGPPSLPPRLQPTHSRTQSGAAAQSAAR